MKLDHHFLIAMPDMADPVFAGTVTYILEHDETGAFGVIVNRPLTMDLSDVFESLNMVATQPSRVKVPIYHGGPVSPEQGFILHPPTERVWLGSLTNDQMSITTSEDILQSIAADAEPNEFIFCLGYSGWSAGQLEEELKNNAWLTVPGSREIIFHPNDDEKYHLALSSLGIDPMFLSNKGGMA